MPIVLKEEKLFLHSLGNLGAWLKYNRKRFLVISVILALFFGGLCVFAESYEERPDNWLEKPGGLNKVTFKMLDDIMSGNDVETVASQVQINYSESGSIMIGTHDSGDLSGAISSINNMCKGLATLFLLITFFLGLITMREKAAMDEEFVRRLLMLILGMVCIYFSMQWSFSIANVGSEVATKVAEGASLSSGEDASALESIKEDIWNSTHIKAESGGIAANFMQFVGNAMTSASYAMDLLIPWLALKVARFVVSIIVWGRALEIIALATMSPLAFMEVPDINNPMAGGGMRYLKNMLALSISGAVIVFILIIVSHINVSLISDVTGSGDFDKLTDAVYQLVILGFAQAGMVGKAQQIAKTAVGVG